MSSINLLYTNNSDHLKTMSWMKMNDGSYFFRTPIIWKNLILMILLHLATIIVFLQCAQGFIQLKTIIFFWLYAFWNAFGILAGAHRLWSHKSYKARLPLRIMLMLMQTAALQNSLYDWCRNHRVHHRYSETDADPHNSNRGFFFAHMGWLLCRKHPDVKTYGKNVNMNDLLSDPVIRFQMKYFNLLALIFWLILPVSISMFILQEQLWTSLLVNCWRYVISLHNTWLVNSLAHLHGLRPYNQNIEPRENKFVTYFALGEGYHNYHHTFPWDYSASELGWRHNFNYATAFIDFFAWIGLAYDLKIPSRSLVIKKFEQFGDKSINTHPQHRSLSSSSSSSSAALFDNIIGLIVVTWPIWIIALYRSILNIIELI